jgi:hypothetical protein
MKSILKTFSFAEIGIYGNDNKNTRQKESESETNPSLFNSLHFPFYGDGHNLALAGKHKSVVCETFFS